MTLQECTALLTPFAVALRADMDEPIFKAYHRVLKDVHVALLEGALEDLTQQGVRFMPSAPELRQASELRRRRLLAATPYEGCLECIGFHGYRTVHANDGQQPTVERCPCKARYLEKLERLGLRESLGDLPGEAGVGENERVYPTMEQLPTNVRQQVQQVASRKQLR